MLNGSLERYFSENKEWFIYGAGIVAFNIAKAIKSIYGTEPTYFLVSENAGMERFIDRKQIRVFCDEEQKMERDSLIVVAVPECYHTEIAGHLENAGFTNYLSVDSEFEYDIMSEYFSRMGLNMLDSATQNNWSNVCLEKGRFTGLRVYMVRSDYDKKLTGDYYIPEYVEAIHAGAALSEKNICVLRDDSGDNISKKNRNYCELTASYWIWKNTESRYKGICHYRRMFMLGEAEISNIFESDADVVLPLPFLCNTDISEQYERYISGEDMNILMNVLAEKFPEDYIFGKKIIKGRLIYNYNMLIAKQEIFDEYCQWIFGILLEVEKTADHEQTRKDRYAGYLGEILTTIFFLKNKDRWKIYHTGKKWMI